MLSDANKNEVFNEELPLQQKTCNDLAELIAKEVFYCDYHLELSREQARGVRDDEESFTHDIQDRAALLYHVLHSVLEKNTPADILAYTHRFDVKDTTGRHGENTTLSPMLANVRQLIARRHSEAEAHTGSDNPILLTHECDALELALEEITAPTRVDINYPQRPTQISAKATALLNGALPETASHRVIRYGTKRAEDENFANRVKRLAESAKAAGLKF